MERGASDPAGMGLLQQRSRDGFARSAARLYRSDPLFRSSLDFAVIGLSVYLFVAPLPVPSLDWLRSSAGSTPQQNASPSASPPTTTAQVADPSKQRKANLSDVRIRREWFKLSPSVLVPELTKAADLIEAGAGRPALEILERLSQPDDPNVLHLSAIAHMLTRDKDSAPRAMKAHQGAAERGHPESMSELGQFLRLGAVGRVDPEAAADWYEKGAAAGSASAASQAGRAYYNGWARPVDRTRAATYYRQAAQGGDAWGMHNYGAALLNGDGAPPDAQAARGWIQKAADLNLPTAQHNLGKMMRKGVGGPRDLDGCLRWWHAAAEQGFAPALHDLGLFYLEPEDGRPADAGRAATYLRQAALRKHGPSQFAYAALYERGAGVSASPVQAFLFYTLALRNGESAARDRLDTLRSRMTAAELETAQKLIGAAT